MMLAESRIRYTPVHAIVRGLAEYNDASHFFGSLLGLGTHLRDAQREGLVVVKHGKSSLTKR